MGTGFNISAVLTGITTIKRVSCLGRFNACTGGSYLVRARTEGAQFDIFVVVSNFYFTVLLHRSITVVSVSVQSVFL